jgi:hypothetical protein
MIRHHRFVVIDQQDTRGAMAPQGLELTKGLRDRVHARRLIQVERDPRVYAFESITHLTRRIDVRDR